MQISFFLRNLLDYFFSADMRGGNRTGFRPKLTIRERRETKGFVRVAPLYHCVKPAVNGKLLQSCGSQMSHPVCLWLPG